MNKQGFECKMAYVADTQKGLKIPEPYQVYIHDFCLFKNIEDVEENNIIVPEIFAFLSKKFNKAKVYIWWLGVANYYVDRSWVRRMLYLLTLPLSIIRHREFYKASIISKVVSTITRKQYSFTNEGDNISHLCASYYALDFIGNKTKKKVYKCIEPISLLFLNKYKNEASSSIRDDRILYNPRRSEDIVKKIEQNHPSYEFMPLENLTQSQLIDTYKKAKLYIDFGPFPGAERIPKEAVLYGCLIITGRHGASNYHGDVPIPDNYKFADDNDLEKILSQIDFCLNNYDSCYHDFDEYRSTVLALESNFEKSLELIFNSGER